MNECEKKWREIAWDGHAAGRFRVYPDHPLNLFVQYSLAGWREFVIELHSEHLPALVLPSFEHIELSRLEISGGLRIGLTLKEEEFSGSFSLICYDLAERSKSASSPALAAAIFFHALARWAELLRKRKGNGLSREEAFGLLGELVVLESLLNESGVTPDALICGWRGPHGDTRDIGVNGVRAEVKAQRSTAAVRLRISSLTQLDDRGDHVYVVLMRFSSATDGRSLVDAAQAVRSRLEGHPLPVVEFERKLALSGFDPEADVANERYGTDERFIYAVTESFPRLIPGSVPAGVTAAQYEVSGPQLEAHRSDWEYLLEAVRG